jgi:hypothetical protein
VTVADECSCPAAQLSCRGEFKLRDAVDHDCVAQATPVAVALSLLLSVQGTNVTWRESGGGQS